MAELDGGGTPWMVRLFPRSTESAGCHFVLELYSIWQPNNCFYLINLRIDSSGPSPASFFNLFLIFFKQTLQQYNVKYVHPVSSAGI